MHFPSFTATCVLALACVPAILGATIHVQVDHTASDAPLTPTRVRRAPDVVAIPHDLHFNPVGIHLHPLAMMSSAVAGRADTNAERLARGLPPRAPNFSKNKAATRARAAGYAPGRRQDAATQPQWKPKPSATPCKLRQETGIVNVLGTDTFGFIRNKATNGDGEYGLTSDPLEALVVVLKLCEGEKVPFEIATLNGFKDFAFLGGVVGFGTTSDELSQGSFNYVYVTGVTSVPLGPPVNAGNAFTAATGISRDIESVVWTLEDGFLSRSLRLNWINPDGQTARGTAAVYVPSADAFAVTGDVNVFMEAFGPAHEVTFNFVQL